MRVLLVENDPKVGTRLVRVLSASGYEVALRPTIAEARAFSGADIDIALVDWTLPDGNGLEVCSHLRRSEFDGPILMLGARGKSEDGAELVALGVDDSLATPLATDELLIRLRVVSRRAPKIVSLDVGPLHLDFGRRDAFAAGELLELTDREFQLLAYLARNADQTVTSAELVENAWDEATMVPDLVDVHVERLRGRLGTHAWMIETMSGIGYRLRSHRASLSTGLDP